MSSICDFMEDTSSRSEKARKKQKINETKCIPKWSKKESTQVIPDLTSTEEISFSTSVSEDIISEDIDDVNSWNDQNIFKELTDRRYGIFCENANLWLQQYADTVFREEIQKYLVENFEKKKPQKNKKGLLEKIHVK